MSDQTKPIIKGARTKGSKAKKMDPDQKSKNLYLSQDFQ